MTLPAFERADFTEEIRKRKLTQSELYLLTLRQLLLNQACLLGVHAVRADEGDTAFQDNKTATEVLARRIEEFLVYKE